MDMSRVRTRPVPRDRPKRTGRGNTTIDIAWSRRVVLPPVVIVVTICIILCRTLSLRYWYKAARAIERDYTRNTTQQSENKQSSILLSERQDTIEVQNSTVVGLLH
jgi:hypothetical protein